MYRSSYVIYFQAESWGFMVLSSSTKSLSKQEKSKLWLHLSLIEDLNAYDTDQYMRSSASCFFPVVSMLFGGR